MLKKIVVIGPESTGKSTLCQQLAAHYNTVWIREYAREYLLEHGTDYTYDDLLTIAQGQLDLEELVLSTSENGPVFIDTNMQVMKVWCEYVFGKVHPWIEEQLQRRSYDLYLLCNTDLPWVKDELREYPDLKTRDELFRIYLNLLKQQSVPYHIIEGSSEQRLDLAIKVVDAL